MFSREKLIRTIRSKRSFLCIGLDTDPDKLPDYVRDSADPVTTFNRRIIEATSDLCIAYKPNTAFYESRGVKGWKELTETWRAIPEDCFSIADAKRGDIGNTSALYAQAFFDEQRSGMSFDAVTVAPYMGHDSVQPFLPYKNKWVILLGLTSNAGNADFQYLADDDGFLFEKVIRRAQQWATPEQLMFVVGATQADAFKRIRKIAPDHFLLVPGVGAQGGSLEDVCANGLTPECGLIVNASRSVIYASSGTDFAEAARAEAQKLQQQMAKILDEAGI
ncbi:MAG: orotidine-5'-phosphate decarboxylase [Mucilaginibacter polytrichastri]|nr:orotidine-5'-phosphate decarboxylase [Mucilaginibacter polytrichastri]